MLLLLRRGRRRWRRWERLGSLNGLVVRLCILGWMRVLRWWVSILLQRLVLLRL